jgi:orotate phosphoribosyltransferase
MSADPSTGLADRLLRASELHGDFVLSSGRRSNVYFDKFRFLADPALLRELAVAVAEIVPKDATHVAAPEGAATLLLAAVALQTGLPLSVIRREAKDYGTMSQVEGYAPKHARVALIEDVSTTGRQVLAAAKAIEEREAEVSVIVLALDRGGADALTEAGYAVRSVVSLRPDA